MAFGDFVVEDGTGLSGATSYVDVEEADSYIATRPDSSWSACSGLVAKRAALMYATDWLDGRYRWKGRVFNEEQALQFPRYGIPFFEGRRLIDESNPDVYPIPDKIKEATIQAALMHISSSVNAFHLEGVATKGPIEEVEAGEVKVRFTNNPATGASPRNPDKSHSRTKFIDFLLDGYYFPGDRVQRG